MDNAPYGCGSLLAQPEPCGGSFRFELTKRIAILDRASVRQKGEVVGYLYDNSRSNAYPALASFIPPKAWADGH